MTTPFYPYVDPGDPEAAVVDILLNHTDELIPYFPVAIRGSMVGYDASLNWVTVTQEGAIVKLPKISRPRVDVESYSPFRDVAYDVAKICLASIVRQMGTYSGFGLNLCDVRVEQGITRVPDKLQETSRFIFALRLTTTPNGDPVPTPS